MERKRKIKDGHIVVKNPLYQELPTHEITIQSGRTLYLLLEATTEAEACPIKFCGS